MRIVVIGNAGGGKSTLSKRLAGLYKLPYHEIDKILWKDGWQLVPESDFIAAHSNLIHTAAWVLDGFGFIGSVEIRLASATHLVHIDLPLWQHYWLAAIRHTQWDKGELLNRPGGFNEPPPLKAVFKMISKVDEVYSPQLRDLVSEAASRGTKVQTVQDVDELDAFELKL